MFSLSTFNTLLAYVKEIFIFNVIMDVISYYISPLSLQATVEGDKNHYFKDSDVRVVSFVVSLFDEGYVEDDRATSAATSIATCWFKIETTLRSNLLSGSNRHDYNMNYEFAWEQIMQPTFTQVIRDNGVKLKYN